MENVTRVDQGGAAVDAGGGGGDRLAGGEVWGRTRGAGWRWVGWGRGNDALAWAQLGWVVLGVAVCVKTWVQPNRHTVYPIFAQAARDWWAGCPPYENQAYFYSPTFAVLVSPFAALPDWLGGMLWSVVSMWAYWKGLRAFYAGVLRGALSARGEALFLGLTLVGSVRGIWSGQSNTLILAGALAGCAAVVQGQWQRAAWLLALPIPIKIWPAALAGLVGVWKFREMSWRIAGATAALAAVPYLVDTPSGATRLYAEWGETLSARQGEARRYPGYRDGWTIWENLAGPVDRRAYLAVLLATAGGRVAGGAWRAGRGRRNAGGGELGSGRQESADARAARLILAGWSVWQVLLGPGSERLTYILVAPAMAWSAVQAWEGTRRGRGICWASLAIVVVVGSGGVERSLLGVWSGARALQPLGLALYAVWLAWSEWEAVRRERREGATAEGGATAVGAVLAREGRMVGGGGMRRSA